MTKDQDLAPTLPTHHQTAFDGQDIETPAYIIHENQLIANVNELRRLTDLAGCSLMYSVKANPIVGVISTLAKGVDGFSCSSLMEAKLAHSLSQKPIHFVAPCLRQSDLGEIVKACNSISFNSLTQLDRFGPQLSGKLHCALRINPEVSLTHDERIDACRPHSKLGVSIQKVRELWAQVPAVFDCITGLHVHNAVGNTDFNNFYRTVQVLVEEIPGLLEKVKWINLGGGYRLQTAKNRDAFVDAINLLKTRFGVEVHIEPGTALLANSCYLVASVEDLFISDGQQMAVLDTSINHQLESYIYNFEPSVASSVKGGPFSYRFAGSTCLAGDLLGDHSFQRPLKIGSRVVFTGVGSYAHPLTTQYNGERPPTIYTMGKDHVVHLKHRFSFADFARFCGASVKPARSS